MKVKHWLLAAAVFCASVGSRPFSAEQPPRAELITSHHGHTPALLGLVPGLQSRPNAPFHVFPLHRPNANAGKGHRGGGSWTDPALQTSYSTSLAASVGISFTGVGASGYVPPDPNISVGPTQIVETTNVQFAVYDKAGNRLLGPAALHTIWSSLGSGSLCATTDGGDPIVLWDKPDGRWIISQLAFNSSFNQNEFCLAISDTSDATGSYHVYDFSFGSSLPDYPKLGVWKEASGKYSGIYFSANMFNKGVTFSGAKMCALPLVSSGLPQSTMLCVQQPTSVYSLLPADLEGTTAAPSATGDFYLQAISGSGGITQLNLFQFRPDFTTPSNTTVTGPTPLSVASFHEACGGGTCVPQPGTSQQLDSLGDRLMYRLSYRNYGSYDSLVVNHSVQVSSASNQTGIRWYEIRTPGSTPTVYQQSTYSPDTSLYRWMASIAQDKVGNFGLGFSISSSSQVPSIAIAGRQASDPLNTLAQQVLVKAGVGVQTSVNRWGDYTSVSVDPTDDCTFWYVNEYLASNGSYTNWVTQITSFRFTSCQ